MSRPVSIENLPPRPREDVGTGGRDEAQIFALKAQADFLEVIRDFERRIAALENRIGRIFIDGG